MLCRGSFFVVNCEVIFIFKQCSTFVWKLLFQIACDKQDKPYILVEKRGGGEVLMFLAIAAVIAAIINSG